MAGTVQAQQSGAWNVGISGTPTVKLDPTSSVAVAAKTVPVVEHQYTNPDWLSSNQDVSAYKSLAVDTALTGTLPAGCAVYIQVIDVISPDNASGSWAIVDSATTLTPANPSSHQTVSVTSPIISLNSYDQPYGCASSIPLDVGIYGRPN